MEKWEIFENEMTSYLREMLDNYDVIVKKYGDSDSTISDVEITINSNNKKFYIETKMKVSQSSQFVVDIKDNKFVYSDKNKFGSNQYSNEIINILNNNFKFYSSVKQKGLIVPISESLAFDWIITNMKNKNVEFLISVDNSGNKKIISLNQLCYFFNIKTFLRRKKSGSQSLPKIYYNDFKRKCDLIFSKYKYKLINIKNKLYLRLPIKLNKSECYIDSDLLNNGRRYYLSNKGNYLYEVKITSSTNNPCIIFSLSLKDDINIDMFTIQGLIDYINDNMC